MERLNLVFRRTITGFTEDVLVATMHFTPATGTALTDTQRAAAEARATTFWNTYRAFVNTTIQLAEFRWYDQQIWPIPSPVVRVTPLGTAGLGATATGLPAQISVSCTLQTQFRRRWGRFYMPGFRTTDLVSTGAGRWNTSTVDTCANGLATFIQGCKTDGAFPVVYSPRGGAGPPAFAAGANLPVTSVRIDDIPDVIRSRRAQDQPYRKIVAIT